MRRNVSTLKLGVQLTDFVTGDSAMALDFVSPYLRTLLNSLLDVQLYNKMVILTRPTHGFQQGKGKALRLSLSPKAHLGCCCLPTCDFSTALFRNF